MTLDEICDGSLPDPGDVALNVPVGNTVGTAVLTEADVAAALDAWTAALSPVRRQREARGRCGKTSERRPAATRRQRASMRPSARREEPSAPVAFLLPSSSRTRPVLP